MKKAAAAAAGLALIYGSGYAVLAAVDMLFKALGVA